MTTPTELKMICDEYILTEEDKWKYEDEYYNYLTAVNMLDKADFILFCLYAHYQSERKVAKIMGLSRTPIHSQLTRIRTQIKNILEQL